MSFYGLLVKWFNTPPSQGGIHGFKSRADYQLLFKVLFLQGFFDILGIISQSRAKTKNEYLFSSKYRTCDILFYNLIYLFRNIFSTILKYLSFNASRFMILFSIFI